jgi:hypothetical protein
MVAYWSARAFPFGRLDGLKWVEKAGRFKGMISNP